MKKLILVVLLITINFISFAQKSNETYRIELKIKGTKDTVMYLANYYGDKTYLADTAYRKGKNSFVFTKNKVLEGGLYIAVNQEKRSVFEFLVSDSRNMKFETDTEQYVNHMKIQGSEENNRFYDYLRFSARLYDRVKPLSSRLKILDPNNDSVQIYRKQIQELNKEMTDYKDGYMSRYKDSFLGHFFCVD